MPKVINSPALGPLNKALGLAGSGDSRTELLDGIVNQVIDVAPIVRRGGAIQGTDGIFRCVMELNFAGAEDQSTSIQPYNPNASGVSPNLAVAPYPSPVPDKYDVYLLGAGVNVISGAGGFTTFLRVTNIQQGWGIDEVGAPTISTDSPVLAWWNARLGLGGITMMLSGGDPAAPDGAGQPWRPLNMRLPRLGATAVGPLLQFAGTASALGVIQCIMYLGVFPISLGQDVLG